MSAIQELTNQQVDEVLAVAVDRRVPVTLTAQRGRSWQVSAARALARRDEHLLLELAADPQGQVGRFIPAENIGVSFKMKHHKHIFTATVVAMEQGPAGEVLVVCRPSRMQRLQRRAYVRAVVPLNRIVRASFWLGGRNAEPTGGSPSTPVWSGRVVNISVGGFQLHVEAAAIQDVESGDTVGVRIVFGMGEQSIYADAEVRHAESVGSRAMIGFRFAGLDQTHEGRAAMQLIAAKVAEYERAAQSERQAADREGSEPVPAAHPAARDD